MRRLRWQKQHFQASVPMTCLAVFMMVGVSFSRADNEASNHRDKRSSSFVRIGKGNNFPSDMKGDDFTSDTTPGADYSTDRGSNPIAKKLSGFVRIGRGSGSTSGAGLRLKSRGYVRGLAGHLTETAERRKKSPSFVRIGKSQSENYRFNSDLEIDELSDAMKRASNFVRIGKTSNFVRIGKSPGNRVARNPLFVRIGKSYSDSSDSSGDKRGSSFVRIGRRAPFFGQSRFDLLTPFDIHNSKRKSQFVRIGKSGVFTDKLPPAPARFDESNLDDLKDYIEAHVGVKKNSHFVRIGKNQDNSEYTWNSQFPDSKLPEVTYDEEGPIVVANRAFVRMGKIPSAHFLRNGKSDAFMNMPEMTSGFRGFKRRNQSSFVRIGK